MAVFRIDRSVFELFPEARFSAVVVRGANNRGENPRVDRLLDAAVESIRAEFSGVDPKSHPNIAAWRDAFSTRGWTPSKYLSSIEALVRRISKGGDLPRISPAVDLANSVSLTFLVPVGAHDLGTAGDGIEVRAATLEDRFQPMGDAPAETPEIGEIVYVHDRDVRTRRWVWRQSRNGLISPDSTDLLFPIDGFAPSTVESVRQAARQLAELVPLMLGGTVSVHDLDPEHPLID